MVRPDPNIDPVVEPADDVAADHETSPDSARPSRPTERRGALPQAARRRAAIATIAISVIALVAGLLAWGSGRPAPDGSATASGLPTTAAGATAAASEGPVPRASADLAFHPISGSATEPVARLTARGAAAGVVPLDTAFRLETSTPTPARTLADRLTIDPPVAMNVVADAADQAVNLAPKAPLRAGTVYRFSLHGAAGELIDTWAFQARQPLRIVGTLPGDEEMDVPTDTGIEVTFDQDGVSGAESHVRISPTTPGRFEQHGRTLAFVPDRRLQAKTLYTVTVSRGVGVDATGESTAEDTTFQFETGAGGTNEPLSFGFPDTLAESPTSERPVLGIWTFGGDVDRMPKTATIGVYRLANLDGAIAAFRSLRSRPTWTQWSTLGLIDTSRLTRVVRAKLSLRSFENAFWVELPERLGAGWYLVESEDGGRRTQTVLQVSDVAGYLAVSDTKTIVWANDLRNRQPIAGAAARSGSISLGRTGADGVLVAATPASLLPGDACPAPCSAVVVVRAVDGRTVFLPASTDGDFGISVTDYGGSDANPAYWSVLRTDRSLFRLGDTAHLWGMARQRSTGAIPTELTIRVRAADGRDDAPAVLTRTVRPLATGAFTLSLPLTGLPAGYYSIAMSAGSRTIRTTWFQVGPIAKPAYTLSVSTVRRVYVDGDRVSVRVVARFYEGTPVPGVPVELDGLGDGSVTTDRAGTATYEGTAAVDPEHDTADAETQSVGARPARAEEGEIDGASDDFLVFPSSRTIDAAGRIADGRVRANGGVHLVAVSRLERALAGGASTWDLDPRGAPVVGATVRVSFVELIPHRHSAGSEYDFLEKRLVERWSYDLEERVVRTVTVQTTADGSWTASTAASATGHDYRVVATVADLQGRVARAAGYADRSPLVDVQGASSPWLQPTSGDRDGSSYGVGDPVDVTMIDPGFAQTSVDGTRYLFFTAQGGIHDVAARASRRYRLDFPSWGPPEVSIGAVRFTGRTYTGTVWYTAAFRVADRSLTVDLTADAARYAPGEKATVAVQTHDAAGHPTAATVIVRAVDEKLFAIGAAVADDPLAELYEFVGSGVRSTYLSHQHPRGAPEGGDTTGGGGDDRSDFRDSLLFRAVTTGPDGHGQLTFDLSDDLTSWRVTAAALTTDLEAGYGSTLLPVGLPFFVDASIAPEYLLADRPSIVVRTFGSGLRSGDAVSIRVTSASLAFDSGPMGGTAFASIVVPLPTLRLGTQTLTITASTGSGATARTDRLTRTFTVTGSRLTTERTASATLPLTRPVQGGSAGFTTVVVSDAGAGRYDGLLSELAFGGGARLDRALAADLARSILDARSGVEGPTAEPAFVLERYLAPDDGLALVPYGSSDLDISTLVAIVAPDRIDRTRLRAYLSAIHTAALETRERQLLALAGLAGLGDPVLPAVQTALMTPDLTIRERLFLALGAAALGDRQTARTVLDDLVATSGEETAELARLRVGSTAGDIVEATALAAVVAAETGSSLAGKLWAYVDANPVPDRIDVLPAIAVVSASLDHLATEPASFAWTIDGERHVVELGRGQSFRTQVTPDQLTTLRLEPLSGAAAVTTIWREPVAATALPEDPDVTITRTVRPRTSVASGDLVVVDLQVTFSTRAADGCREVTELVPSGLAPVGPGARWYDPESGDVPPDPSAELPYAQSGSRVSFCASPGLAHRTVTLRYVARVVTPGTYAWEPAVAQAPLGDRSAAVTPAGSITITE